MTLSHSDAERRRSSVRDFLAGGRPLTLIALPGEDLRDRMRREVLAGLADPRGPTIPPAYLYDARGSELYEQITALPEYYPTRTEARLLTQVAPLLAERLAIRQLVELGSGSSAKTRLLLDAFEAGRRGLTYVPIDISRELLGLTAEQLVEAYPGMRVLAIAAPFDEAVALLPPCEHRLVLFLGGTLGNFPQKQQEAFFRGLHAAMTPGNHLLLGFDRRAHAGKPVSILHAAYNDAQGVTSQFNENLLIRLNRELGADFDAARWRHRATYEVPAHQIAMVLESQGDQEVRVAGRAFRFRAGEGILTEVSRKFDPEELALWLAERGFARQACWTDAEETYGLMLLRREG
ncbi:Histidine-specific methyltransferase EgtD [compost metagenome]